MNEASASLNRTKDIVKSLLCDHPETRDCDKQLILRYMYHCHKAAYRLDDRQGASWKELKEIFEEMPSFETIRRTRQKIQEEGLYRGERYNQRHQRSSAVRDWAIGERYFN